MNTRFSASLRALLLAIFLPVCMSAGTARADLDALFAHTMVKIKSGQHTEAELAPELAQFDTLLVTHKGEAVDDVARILLMKATLYLQIIGDDTKGIALLQQLKTDYPTSSFVKNVDSLIASTQAANAFPVGSVFPDFAEQDMNGQPLSIANYRGKVVLLDFWATWCPPCLAELPNVVEAYKKYHDRGFEIIGVSLDRANAREKLVEFTQNREMPWAQFYDGKEWKNKLSLLYGISAIPATFLLDGDGRVIAKNLRGAALAAELEKRLGAK